jgi:dipeptidyl aminopeptidase/acylaminoacyl peptidase
MYVGAQDDVCPAPQSYELWRALRRMGVPTQLMVYDQEGHGIARPRNQRDLSKRTIRWFAQYLPKRPG